jgi:hypothetical protein
MDSTFSELMNALAKTVPMKSMVIGGDEFRRFATLTPVSDGKERVLFWRGVDPNAAEFPTIVNDLIAHLSLSHPSKA